MRSISVNRILANHDNAVATAAITASVQRPSTDIRLLEQRRIGGGRMTLAGPFSGEADSTVEVEIIDGAGTSLRASAPVINGVGNGQLTITALDIGALPETLTFTLADAGHPAEHAVLDFFGAQLAARVPGEAGNALSIEVTRNLTTAPMPYTTLEMISAGRAELEGAAWHWGQPPGVGTGIPPTALRVQFEGFPQVHRTWKTWRDGAFVFHLDPAPAWDIPANTRVLAVSGGYTLVVSDGTVTETYADVVTVYDFLTALRARSALVEVRGAIAADTAAGGMAVTDIPLRTDAQALPATIKVASEKLTALTGVTVQPDAPTENIIINYVGAAAGGGDAWTVEGGISGVLPNARTGTPYAHGPVGFTIPAPAAASVTDTTRIRAKYVPIQRQPGEGLPGICFKPLLLGAQPKNKTVTFTYTARSFDCKCEHLPPLPVSLACLGLADGGYSMSLSPEFQTRLVALYRWRAEFFNSNTLIGPVAIAIKQDLDFADRITGTFAVTLERINEYADALPVWDEFFSTMQLELLALAGLSGITKVPSTEATTMQGGPVGSIYYHSLNRHYYKLIYAAYTNMPQDVALPYNYSYTADGGRVEQRVLPAFGFDSGWAMDGSVTVLSASRGTSESGDALLSIQLFYQDLSAGVTEGAERQNLEISPDESGSYSYALDQFVRRYSSQMDQVLATAGIIPDPKSDASGVAGHVCWRDYGDSYWWVDESGEYLPVFTNKPYVSASRMPDGSIVGTQEFGFGIVTECAHRLKEDDKITITIDGAGAGAYASGDCIVIPVIGAAGAAFNGGSEGDATQTWAVRGSLSGDLPDWLYLPSAPMPYTGGPATAELAAGAIPFEVGDVIGVALEGGRLRWRSDGGAWAEGDLFGVHALDDGLTLSAAPGAAPSFVTGDYWRFQAVATYGVSRLRRPRVGQAYAWDGPAAVLDIDLGAVTDIEAVALALHTLPVMSTITISGGEFDADEWTLTPAWRDGPIVAPLPGPRAVRFLRVRIDDAGAGAAIGWLWAGMGWQPTVGASELTQARQYGMARGSGINPGALYRGRGMGGRWAWRVDDGGALEADCADALLALVDHVAEQGVEPVCLVADIREPERASLALLDADEVSFADHINWQHAGNRAVSVDLPFRAVLG